MVALGCGVPRPHDIPQVAGLQLIPSHLVTASRACMGAESACSADMPKHPRSCFSYYIIWQRWRVLRTATPFRIKTSPLVRQTVPESCLFLPRCEITPANNQKLCTRASR